MSEEIYLANGQCRALALQAVKDAKLGSYITIERKRTAKQNSRYWSKALLSQISQKAVVNGQRFSVDAWHEFFKREFIGIEELPDGSIRGKSSKDLNVEDYAKFADQVEAYAATELGVVFVYKRVEECA